MAYKALYREFRPRRFDEVKGQEAIVAVLKNQIRQGKPAHAYLFAGPRGTGKTSTAKILATALNCTDLKDGEPCLECENCRQALSDSMIDIIEMDAASNNGVDNARDLRDKVNLLPARGRYKVYIIDEVHMLSQEAFNALLKTLEEPPPHVVFILATTELNMLPRTILSRCQRFDFRAIDEAEMIERMREVLAAIGKTADDAALAAVADAAAGGLRDALTLLEKCCSLADHITTQIVGEVTGYADRANMRAFLLALGQFDERAALTGLLGVLEGGVQPDIFLSQLLAALREMLLAKVMGDRAEDEAANAWSKQAIVRALEILSETQIRMFRSPSSALLLETAVMRLLLPESEADGKDMLLRVEKLEKKLHGASLPPRERAAEPALPQKPAAAPVKKEKKAPPPASEDEALWRAILQKAGDNAAARPFLQGLRLLRREGKVLHIGSDNPARLRSFKGSAYHQKLDEAAKQLLPGAMLSFDLPEEEDGGQVELFTRENIDIID